MSIRIFAEGISTPNEGTSGLNGNDLIIGSSGAGKTTGYVIPNINRHFGSMVVADTKGNLARMLTPSLEEAGYHVETLDFYHPEHSCCYNPLSYIRTNRDQTEINEQDIVTITEALYPEKGRDPYWDNAGRLVLSSLIGFVMEKLPRREQNIASVMRIFAMNNDVLKKLFGELEKENPDSFAVRRFHMYRDVMETQTTWGCIQSSLGTAIGQMARGDLLPVLTGKTVDFRDLGRRKTVLFVNVSDVDRSIDKLYNIFYTQLFTALIQYADQRADSTLPVPVRIYLDDFATNLYIPHFDGILSVIRSRGISASIMLQSLTQLDEMYGRAGKSTIINNCDHLVYLGGQDLETAEYIASRAAVVPEKILWMDRDEAYVFERGKKPKTGRKIEPFRSEKDPAKWGENER